MLQRDTGIPTKVFNDLDSVLLHECWFGDAIGVPRFAVITMGAGVGYSISDHGDPIDNPDKSYGLAGHVLIDPEGAALLLRAYRLLAMPDVRLDRRGILGHHGACDHLRGVLARSAGEPAAGAQTRRTHLLPARRACGDRLESGDALTRARQRESSFIAKKNREFIRKGIDAYRHSQAAPVEFSIPRFSWRLWSDSAAARAIATYIS